MVGTASRPSSGTIRESRQAPRPWWEALPPAISFMDVETTGLGASDKIVSFAAIRLNSASLAEERLDLELMHLVFDPGRESHWRAEQVHGYSDWLLRHQERFDQHAEAIWKFIHRGNVIVAHNASFDSRFVGRELVSSGCPPIARPLYCTMESYRNFGLGGSASLDAVCGRMGLQRIGKRHGALEDAWLAMNIYLAQQGCRLTFALPNHVDLAPKNLRAVPPAPKGKLPPRA